MLLTQELISLTILADMTVMMIWHGAYHHIAYMAGRTNICLNGITLQRASRVLEKCKKMYAGSVLTRTIGETDNHIL